MVFCGSARRHAPMEPQPNESDTAQAGNAGRSDRRDRDGMAGAGDMTGGLSAGAGSSLGIDAIDETDAHEFEPGPISGHQHDLESGEPRTDSATAAHPAGDPAASGSQEFQGYGGAEGDEGA